MRLQIDINLDNAAYEDTVAGIVWTLEHYIKRIKESSDIDMAGDTYLKDSNGNTVGYASIFEED